MLHPNQFQVNDAWIAFQINDAPIETEEDGDLDIFALMDAASCFILSSTPSRAVAGELSTLEAEGMLKEGRAHKQELPKTLFIPDQMAAQSLTRAAERHGITVVRVPEDQLMAFIGEVRALFREHF